VVDLVYVSLVIKDEERTFGSYKHAMMLLEVGGLKAVVFADLTAHEIETNYLMVDRNIHLFLCFIVVIVREK
jgi:hypothetical protein